MNICNGAAYITEQTTCLIDHLQQNHTIIIGGKLFGDDILTALFPGYQPNSQYSILKQCITQCPHTTLTYMLHAKDLIQDKQLSQKYCSFEKTIITQLKQLTEIQPNTHHIQVKIILLDDFIPPPAQDFALLLQQHGRETTFIIPNNKYTPRE